MTLTVPAEWTPHRAMWLGFPSHADLWAEDLTSAQGEVAALARALAGPGDEAVRLLVCGESARASAERLTAEIRNIEIIDGVFGDIWLRDTAPIFTSRSTAAAFRFNGWGGKYVLEGDEAVPGQIADHSGVDLASYGFVLEGGAVEHDGAGTILTTRQCLLNANRNSWTQAEAEAALARTLGAEKVLWLDDGLINDHTDGHIDNLARFIAPGVVACPVPFGHDDPNTPLYDAVAAELAGMTDALGRLLKVVRIPSPGRILDDDGEVVPASHMNFLIANRAVVVPTYEDVASRYAIDALRILFPDREVIGLPSRAVLTGGGSFHCITQQEPA